MKEMLDQTGSDELAHWAVFLRLEDERRLAEQTTLMFGGAV